LFCEQHILNILRNFLLEKNSVEAGPWPVLSIVEAGYWAPIYVEIGYTKSFSLEYCRSIGPVGLASRIVAFAVLLVHILHKFL
jgi:hypothetical protein